MIDIRRDRKHKIEREKERKKKVKSESVNWVEVAYEEWKSHVMCALDFKVEVEVEVKNHLNGVTSFTLTKTLHYTPLTMTHTHII